MDRLHSIDQKIFLWINDINSEIADPFMHAFSGQWVWVLFYASITAVLIWKYGWRKGLLAVALIAVGIGCADFVCASIIRPIVGRLRPANPDNPISMLVHIVNDYRGGAFGFPSCHGANTFALAISSSYAMRNRAYTITIFVWALLQCYSRIYLGVHYPGDIAAGAFIGSAFGLLAAYCMRYLQLGEGNKKATALLAVYTGLATVTYLAIKTFLFP